MLLSFVIKVQQSTSTSKQEVPVNVCVACTHHFLPVELNVLPNLLLLDNVFIDKHLFLLGELCNLAIAHLYHKVVYGIQESC